MARFDILPRLGVTLSPLNPYHMRYLGLVTFLILQHSWATNATIRPLLLCRVSAVISHCIRAQKQEDEEG